MRRLMLAGMVVGMVGMVGETVAMAQPSPIPTRYRVTRTASGHPTVTHTFLKSAMTCNLSVIPVGVMNPSTLRITDPERLSNPTRDCEWIDSAGSIILNAPREVPLTITIAGLMNEVDGYGPESAPFVLTLPRIPQIPGAPGNLRFTPPSPPSVGFEGVVEWRAPQFGVDAAKILIPALPGFNFYVGGDTLTSPGQFSVQAGDRLWFQFWRETP